MEKGLLKRNIKYIKKLSERELGIHKRIVSAGGLFTSAFFRMAREKSSRVVMDYVEDDNVRKVGVIFLENPNLNVLKNGNEYTMGYLATSFGEDFFSLKIFGRKENEKDFVVGFSLLYILGKIVAEGFYREDFHVILRSQTAMGADEIKLLLNALSNFLDFEMFEVKDGNERLGVVFVGIKPLAVIVEEDKINVKKCRMLLSLQTFKKGLEISTYRSTGEFVREEYGLWVKNVHGEIIVEDGLSRINVEGLKNNVTIVPLYSERLHLLIDNVDGHRVDSQLNTWVDEIRGKLDFYDLEQLFMTHPPI